jgi:ribosomal protein S18 acetylase RimI-like enzyme
MPDMNVEVNILRNKEQPFWLVEEVNFNQNKEAITSLVNSCKLSTEYLDKGERWWLVQKNRTPIGCITIETRDNLVHIQSLCVDPNYRRQGIAKALVDKVFDQAVKKEQTLIAMTLFWNNKIYKAMDFELLPTEFKTFDDVGAREKHKYCTVLGKRN